MLSATAHRVCPMLRLGLSGGTVAAVGRWHVRHRTRSFYTAPQRDRMEYDAVIVGAGPAGLSAAIHLKQRCKKADKDLSVCVVEKAPELGAHTLSGCVLEPTTLRELLPHWKKLEAPLETPVTKDRFMFLTKRLAIPLITLPQMNNHGNYIISLGKFVRWLGEQAEDLGVEIFPGFAASEVLHGPGGEVCGVATGDMGIGKDGKPKSTFQPGIELHSKLVLFAEGCRGHLSRQMMEKYKLYEGVEPQSYGLGVKEVWEIDPSKHNPGRVVHTVGWPLDMKTYGGSFIYHWGKNLLSIGFVVGLDYENPYLSPYWEFQRFKHHPSVRKILEGGTCISYGARTLNEGGFQSIPRLTFPGGALIGCAAGFLNTPKIKGVHTAMKSGMIAADATFDVLTGSQGVDPGVILTGYPGALQQSWMWDELYRARNVHPSFKWGLVGGACFSALDSFILRGKAPFTLTRDVPDHKKTKPKKYFKPIKYPKPDGKISFDILDNVYRSGTNHEEDQPVHLTLKDPTVPRAVNYDIYGGPEANYCPAKVYEYHPDHEGKPSLVINALNCLHCKACDIKDPTQNITWVTPEGGGGPKYTNM